MNILNNFPNQFRIIRNLVGFSPGYNKENSCESERWILNYTHNYNFKMQLVNIKYLYIMLNKLLVIMCTNYNNE